MPRLPAEPYNEEELEDRSKAIYARPWPRIFATLHSLMMRISKLEKDAKKEVNTQTETSIQLRERDSHVN